jgi:hypothetical protein
VVWNNIVGVFTGQPAKEDYLNFNDVNDIVFRMVGNQLRTHAAQHLGAANACNKTNLMDYLSSIYSVNIPMHVAGPSGHAV